ncbi:hypothetical protein ACUNWD_08875 [Sunxiuqinia sp. A32]|uniref:hypothetical protein n=1 Tax=Sunxiuqinia sp. A32 TaxID=3461496 RepID=UPI00404573E8
MEKSDAQEIKIIREELQLIKSRLSKIESVLKKQSSKDEIIREATDVLKDRPTISAEVTQEKKSLEVRAGEYGMAWLGNIILLFGFIFLVGYLENTSNPLISLIAGVGAVAGIYISAFFTRNSYNYLSKLFIYSGHLLLYFVIIRLHFFQKEPLIENSFTAMTIILFVLASLFYLAYHAKLQIMSAMVLLMMLATGIISNSIPFLAGISTIVSVLVLYLYFKYDWIKLFFAFIFLVYFGHLCWLLNNPLLNLQIELLESPGLNYLNLFATGFIFSLIALIPPRETISKEIIIAAIIWNGLGFTFSLVLATIFYSQSNFIPLYSSIAVFCLIFSFLLQIKSEIKITASMYAIYGFLAMSVALYGIFLFPRTYMFLALQSLLVVSMALWFRSRFIVVMNTILYLILLIVYLSTSSKIVATDFAFMLTAFLTARIINWKKERLNIRTELMRNFYLLAGFIMTLIAFSHVFPEAYITASWILAAILFFLMSLLLKNFKYRWLAIATMVTTSVKLIFYDMSNIDIGYRVLLFLLLAFILITVSIIYTKYLTKKKE